VQTNSPRLSRILEGTAIAAFALFSTVAIARIGLEPSHPSGAVGVIFAPWTDAGTAFTRAVSAGGRFVRYGGSSFVVVVEPDSADYVSRVKAAGALLIVDPRIIAACLALTADAQGKK
jgi:hypothetical protein